MYNKGADWYISKEAKPVAKKLEKRINKSGTPKVKVGIVTKNEVVNIEIKAPLYAKYQDKGVKGIESGRSLAGYKFGSKMPPPKAFSRYASKEKEQFAIAKSVHKKGIPAKKHIESSIGFFAPQFKKAADRGVKKYVDSIILN